MKEKILFSNNSRIIVAAALLLASLKILRSESVYYHSTLRWKTSQPGLVCVISYSTNLYNWQRVATNSQGTAQFVTDSPKAFFKIELL
jgi:hypothetical protein